MIAKVEVGLLVAIVEVSLVMAVVATRGAGLAERNVHLIFSGDLV